MPLSSSLLTAHSHMTDIPDRTPSALEGHYTIKRELGRGGMARQRGSGGSEGSGLPDTFSLRFTAHRTPHTAQ